MMRILFGSTGAREPWFVGLLWFDSCAIFSSSNLFLRTLLDTKLKPERFCWPPLLESVVIAAEEAACPTCEAAQLLGGY